MSNTGFLKCKSAELLKIIHKQRQTVLIAFNYIENKTLEETLPFNSLLPFAPRASKFYLLALVCSSGLIALDFNTSTWRRAEV
jgi:hypothetical protein